MPASSQPYEPQAVYGTALAAQIANEFEAAPSEGAGLPRSDAGQSYREATFDGPGEEDGVLKNGSVETEVDIAIIGSGITGVSAAYHLVRSLLAQPAGRAWRIAVLEARGFCSGATGRNGGLLVPVSALAYADLTADQAHLSRFLDIEPAQAGGSEASAAAAAASDPSSATRAGRAEVWGNDRGHKTDEAVRRMLTLEARVAAELLMLCRTDGMAHVDAQLKSGGSYVVASNADEEKGLDESLERAKRAGLSDWARGVKKLTREEVDKELSKPAGVHAVYSISGASVHPRRLVAMLWALAREAAEDREDVELKAYVHCPVHSVEELQSESGARVLLKTARGEVKARHVVHATNAWASHLAPQLAGPHGIVPTRGQVIAAVPATPIEWSQSIGANDGYEYLHTRSQGGEQHVILGGGRTAAPHADWGETGDEQLTFEASEFLRSWLPTTLPHNFTDPISVAHEWSGIMGFTRSRNPIVGPLLREGALASQAGAAALPGQFVAAGYSGHGMPRAFACAEVVAGMIAAEESQTKWQCPEWFPLCYFTTLPA